MAFVNRVGEIEFGFCFTIQEDFVLKYTSAFCSWIYGHKTRPVQEYPKAVPDEFLAPTLHYFPFPNWTLVWIGVADPDLDTVETVSGMGFHERFSVPINPPVRHRVRFLRTVRRW